MKLPSIVLKYARSLLAIGALSSSIAVSQAHATTYELADFGGFGIQGTVTTDGKTGSLSSSDITNFNLCFDCTNPHGYWGGSPASGALLYLWGSGLTATSAGLYLDFTATAYSELLFSFPQENINGPSLPVVLGTYLAYCDASSSCSYAAAGANFGDPSTVRYAWVAQGCCATGGEVGESGNVEIGSAITGVPEPATWAMMLVGFACLGFAGYRASRKTAT
jgi:hypothetical protein